MKNKHPGLSPSRITPNHPPAGPVCKRREFLRATAGAALFSAITGGYLSPASGAETPRSKISESLAALLAQMESQGRQMLSVPRADGQFLNLLIKASRAKSVLEIGTSQGYSAIWIALALEETSGKLTTIDIALEKVKLAKENLGKSGLTERVTFLEGDAHKIVPELSGPFDFVFLDADKEGQLDYFQKLYPNKLVPGGVVAVHNAIRAANAMRPYLDMIGKHRDFDSVTLSMTMEDGFSVAYRHRQ